MTGSPTSRGRVEQAVFHGSGVGVVVDVVVLKGPAELRGQKGRGFIVQGLRTV